MTTETKTRIITMTDAPPVRIREDQWPVIAHGAYSAHDNEHEFQANRRWSTAIRVREHQDGRRIVYGVYDYSSQYRGDRDVTLRAGVRLDADGDVVAAIREVAATLAEALVDGAAEHVAEACRDCIADLPPVDA
jgi:hypothetical protein